MTSTPAQRMKIGDFLLRRLKEAGLRHLFGVPGDYNLELLQQLQDFRRAEMDRHMQRVECILMRPTAMRG